MIRFVSLLLGVLMITYCQQPTEPTYASDEERIVGSWNWEGTSGGIAGQVWTPESEGYTRTWCFSDERILYIWQIDSLVDAFTYNLSVYVRHWDEKEVPVLYLDDRLHTGYGFKTDNSLILDDAAIGIADGYSSEFSRIQ